MHLDEPTRIRVAPWHTGRFVLAGDAASCVTPMGGGGASLALVSGYVLAAHLSGADATPTGTSAGLRR